jgi:hypothetical protein
MFGFQANNTRFGGQTKGKVTRICEFFEGKIMPKIGVKTRRKWVKLNLLIAPKMLSLAPNIGNYKYEYINTPFFKVSNP